MYLFVFFVVGENINRANLNCMKCLPLISSVQAVEE